MWQYCEWCKWYYYTLHRHCARWHPFSEDTLVSLPDAEMQQRLTKLWHDHYVLGGERMPAVPGHALYLLS